MTEFESRPHSVKAWLLSDENADEVARESGGSFVAAYNAVTGDPILTLSIPTMGGIMNVEAGQYVYQSSAGTWHKADKDAFESNFIRKQARRTGVPLQHMPGFPRQI